MPSLAGLFFWMNVKLENIKKLDVSRSLKLDCGKTISNFPLAYETYGKLNANKDNQGAAVGLAMVAPGIGFAVGPFLSGILYSTSMNLPFVFILPLYFLLIIIIKKLELINSEKVSGI